MMEYTSNYLLASSILLWITVIGLSLLVLALTRQIGVLHERIAPAGALMMNQTLKVGDAGPQVLVQNLNRDQEVTIGKPTQPGRSQFLFFLSPDCPVCKSLLPVVKSAQGAESDWLDVIFASDGSLSAHQDYIKQQGLAKDIYVSSEQLGRAYGVSKLPFAVLIDDSGKIASYGLVNSREHIESLFESKERNIPSIQAYINAATPQTERIESAPPQSSPQSSSQSST